MTLAVIADVHSNLHALRAVLEEISNAGAEGVACAGDIVGYGAHANDCCRLVKESAGQVVLGNHDISALSGNTSGMNPYAAQAARWTAGRLTLESKYFLRSRKHGERFSFGGVSVAMFHGSPKSPNEYVYEEHVTESMLRSSGADLLILGHTHVPFVVRLASGTVLNPGSVGQPRDGDPRASFALFDPHTRGCEVRRVEYPIKEAAEAIESAGLPKLLAERLYRGR